SPETLPLVPLAKESLHLYPDFVSRVEEASGRSTAFVNKGTLQVFPGPGGEAERQKMAAEYRQHGLRFEPISLDDARKLEISLGPAIQAAAFLPNEAVVDPRLLTDAVIEAARNRGVEFRHNSPVTSALHDGNRCDGVIASGEKISAKSVIVAAGAYSGGIDWLPRYAPEPPGGGRRLGGRPRGCDLS